MISDDKNFDKFDENRLSAWTMLRILVDDEIGAKIDRDLLCESKMMIWMKTESEMIRSMIVPVYLSDTALYQTELV